MPRDDVHDATEVALREARTDERLVELREGVLNDVEHAVGNLLQRMHHAARSARAEMGVHGERLQSALTDLERLLDLLFGYVSPVDVDVRAMEAARVAESLAAQVRGQGVEVQLGAVPAVRVLADPRVLGRSLQLLAESRSWAAAGPMALSVSYDAASERVAYALRGPGEATVLGAPGALAVAVAGRLIDLQGGALASDERGGCAVTLPVAG